MGGMERMVLIGLCTVNNTQKQIYRERRSNIKMFEVGPDSGEEVKWSEASQPKYGK